MEIVLGEIDGYCVSIFSGLIESGEGFFLRHGDGWTVRVGGVSGIIETICVK